MATGNRSHSPINWDLERQLQEKGYTVEDTDGGQAYEKMISGYPELNEMFQALSPLEANDFFNRDHYQHQLPREEPRPLLQEQWNTDINATLMQLKDERQHKKKQKKPVVNPHLPGTPSTRVRPPVVAADHEAVHMNRRESKFAAAISRESYDSGESKKHRHEKKSGDKIPPSPPYYTWQDTEAFKRSLERDKEISQPVAKVRTPKLPPAPPLNVPRTPSLRDNIVRPTVWKSEPVKPQTDYYCGEGRRPNAAISISRKSEVREKRRSAAQTLLPEPEPGDGIISLAIMLPSGKRIRRRFDMRDTLKDLRTFIWSHEEAPDMFRLFTSAPRKEIVIDSRSFMEADMSSQVLHVVAT